jgi:Protein of unknown function (DUF2971)
MRFHDSDPPGELFHYTTADSLFNIERTKQFWATSVQFMNDAAELTLAIKRVIELLRTRAALEPPLVSKNLTGLAASLSPSLLTKDRDFGRAVTVCAVSLSAEGDLLSQWRAYSRSTLGYAIGIRTSALQDFLANKPWRLARCRYTEADRDALLTELINQTIALIIDGPNLLEQFWTFFLNVAPLIKHEGFKEEAEWRILSRKLTMDSLSFRPSASLIIPYAPLDLPLYDVTRRVRVGPHPHQELAIASTTGFLESVYRTRIDVDASVIPYRSLQ